jgi:hypothetical protein
VPLSADLRFVNEIEVDKLAALVAGGAYAGGIVGISNDVASPAVRVFAGWTPFRFGHITAAGTFPIIHGTLPKYFF